MVDRSKNQAEVISDLFQELGYRTEIYKQSIPPHGWGVVIKTSNHSPPPHQAEHAGHNVALVVVDDHGNMAVDWDNPENFAKKILNTRGLEKFVTDDRPKFKSLEIYGRRWFQRTYGNTYHTAEIIIDDKLVHKTPKQYGYGEGYVQSAREWLVKNGYLSPIWAGRPLHYLRDYGVQYSVHAEDVPRQRDL